MRTTKTLMEHYRSVSIHNIIKYHIDNTVTEKKYILTTETNLIGAKFFFVIFVGFVIPSTPYKCNYGRAALHTYI